MWHFKPNWSKRATLYCISVVCKTSVSPSAVVVVVVVGGGGGGDVVHVHVVVVLFASRKEWV